MSTYIIGIVLLVMIVAAAKHLWNNLSTGKSDCCGCSGCCSHGAGSAAGNGGCSCCGTALNGK